MRDRSPQALWEAALGQLELQVTRPNFDTWLRDTVGLDLAGDELIVGVPTDFCVEWLRSRMDPQIARTVSKLFDERITVSFQVLGAPDLRRPAAPGDATSTVAGAPPKLDPRLTFETFTVVKSSRLAYRAAKRVASGDVDYNPLVLYGAPGLGKTHLLHATGHRALRSGKRVVALTAEAFVDRYGTAVRTGKAHTFRDIFHGCDLLLLDDLRFLATKSASQEQFFHIFNNLHANGCLLVLTVDAHLDNIPGLSKQLLSRLTAGLALELTALSPDDRRKIVEAKAKKLARQLPPTIVDLIANQPFETIRELEGALNRAAAFDDLNQAELSRDEALQALYPLQEPPAPPSADDILALVCRHFNLTLQQLSGPSRARDIAYARHIAMYLLRTHAPRPLAEIGHLLGGRDHSTVLHAYQRIKKEQATLPQTRADIDHIESTLHDSSAA